MSASRSESETRVADFHGFGCGLRIKHGVCGESGLCPGCWARKERYMVTPTVEDVQAVISAYCLDMEPQATPHGLASAIHDKFFAKYGPAALSPFPPTPEQENER